MDKDKIINYVMSTPENSNYSVLKSLLDSEDDTGSEAKLLKVTLTNGRAGNIAFYGTFVVDGKVCGLKLILISAGETKEVEIPFNIGTNGVRSTTYCFINVIKDSAQPVFSAGISSVSSGKISAGAYDTYRCMIPSSFTDDELICTVT